MFAKRKTFHKKSDAIIWARDTEYQIDKKQYLAVIASGGRYHNYTKSNGELYIFSLK